MSEFKLKDENLYYIGGVVRDEVLGIPCFDVDLTYKGNAIEFCEKLKTDGICEILQINEPFATARILIDGREVDIASTRDERYDKKGHLPTVFDIGCSLRKDVERRDFTINTLAKSTLTGEIVDILGGLADIKNKVIRVLHDSSFVDDPTRILRALKFAVRFGFELDDYTRQLQENYLNNIDYDMSFKRLKKEIMETFNLNSQIAYDRFIDQKIYLLIGEQNNSCPRYNIQDLINKHPVDNVWIVYVGWHDNIGNLPLTKEEQKIIDEYKILLSTEIKPDSYSIYKAFKSKPKESILLYTILTGSELGMDFFEIEDIEPVIDGNDLKSLGVEPSKKYSECTDFILEHKLKSPNLTKEDELNLAKSFFGI